MARLVSRILLRICNVIDLHVVMPMPLHGLGVVTCPLTTPQAVKMPKLYKGQNPNVYLEEARRKDFNEYYQRKIASVKKSIDCYAPK